jgi:hypothetical protein
MEGGGGSGTFEAEQYRLDDLWILECHFDRGFVGCKLFPQALDVWVEPPLRYTGDRVDFRFSQDENQLQLRLLDEHNQEIDAATLQRGVDFELSGGRLTLHGPFSGLHRVNNNWGPEFTSQRDRLQLSTAGGLLGSSSRNGGMLCMDVIPTVVIKKYWWVWPRITN